MTHGASIEDSCYRTANFVHRILQGAKPADLPMEIPLRSKVAFMRDSAKPPANPLGSTRRKTSTSKIAPMLDASQEERHALRGVLLGHKRCLNAPGAA
jgi:hypothetical protein